MYWLVHHTIRYIKWKKHQIDGPIWTPSISRLGLGLLVPAQDRPAGAVVKGPCRHLEDMVLCSTLSHPRFFFCGSLLRSKTSTIEVLRSENDDFEPIPSFGQAVPRIPSKCAEFYALDMPCWCLGQNLCGFIKIHRWKPTHFLQNFWEPPALATKTVKGFHTAALASACDTAEG